MGLGAAAMLGLGKLKYVLVALKMTKMAPVLSMVATSVAYSAVFGPAYGCGMVGLIFCHEAGHAVAMRYYNIPFGGMIFIPFVGAAVAAEKHPKTAGQEVVIALAGPYFGTAAATVTALAGHLTDSQLLMALADWGFMINAFNLFPLYNLDGGRVADALSPWIPAFGLAGGCGLAYAGIVNNPIFYLLLFGGALQVGGRALGWNSSEPMPWKRLRGPPMFLAAGAYAAVLAFIVAGMRLNNTKRKTPRQLMNGEHHAPHSSSDPENIYDDYFATFEGIEDDGSGGRWG